MKSFIVCFGFLVFLVGIVSGNQVFDKDTLYASGRVREFTGRDLQTIAFPIGGLGTGNITLGGRGEFREFEVFNRPNKGHSPDMTFFALWVKPEGGNPAARILERRLIPPYVGWMGFPRNQLAGVARFEEAVFKGEYPFAHLKLIDKDVPVKITLMAYNPFVPLSPEKSGMPGAVFVWTVQNPTDSLVQGAISFSMMNPIRTKDENGRVTFGKNLNQYIDEGQYRGIKMTTRRAAPEDLESGSLAIVTTEKDVDVQARWYRGGWWDNAHVFWDDFSADGRISQVRDSLESDPGRSDVATVSVPFDLGPGEQKVVHFYLTWFFPNRENYWNREEEVKEKKFKNHYADRFDDAWDVARSLVENHDELYEETKAFHDLLFQSTYPSYVIDALSSQMSSLKTNLVMRTEDGKFFGFEGLSDDAGCCPMNCTHVWNYEQTLAYLFPSLERTVRETDFLHNTFANGYQVFRTLVPLGDYWWTYKPCADGQMGNIVRVFREWKMSGDTDWLKKMWPRVKAALEFAWKGVGDVDGDLSWQKERLFLPWDPNKDGVMEGEQHNTYDIEYYGPNTMTGSLYLAALKASVEMATAVGEKEKADEYQKTFEQGSKKYDATLWNGEYYIQKVEVMEGLVVPEHLRSPEKGCEDPACTCNASPGGEKQALESGALVPKYQYGEGCLSDQLLGQYLAHVSGLGYILDKVHVDTAITSIFAHNFKRDLSGFSNVQRVYALNDEAGLLLCSWPKGNRPALPFVYSDEVWTGIEYQVAASLIYSGHVDEGLTIVKAVRDRHSGHNRNPWDEFECGHHYARAMASWAVLLALSGFEYDGVAHAVAFAPRISKEDFRSFWSTGSGWGGFEAHEHRVQMRVAYGNLKMSQLGLSQDVGFRSIKSIKLDGRPLSAELTTQGDRLWINFEKAAEMKAGQELICVFER